MARVPLLNWPVAQTGQLVDCGRGWNWPATHPSHAVALSASWKYPGSHGPGAPERVGHSCPRPHRAHARDPCAVVYHPGVQSSHPVFSLRAWNCPGAHASHSAWPHSACTVPGAHASHCVRPGSGCTDPGAHGSGSRAASGHREPSGHTVQLARLNTAKRPESHAVQAVPSRLLWKRPSAHGSHEVVADAF